MKNPLRTMSADALYAQLGRLIADAPDLKAMPYAPLTNEQRLWIARAEALVSEVFGAIVTGTTFSHIMQQFSQYRPWASDEVMLQLHRALASVETELPAPATGAFIPAGSPFEALKAVQRIFEMAKREVLIIDPYMDAKILTDFVVLAPPKITIRLLTDSGTHKATLLPAIRAFKEQYQDERPLSAKAAPARSLHDRLVAVDGQRVWTVGQSFNALVARSPTSFVEADKETAALKLDAYEEIWKSADPIPKD
jgi:hypothetical protein